MAITKVIKSSIDSNTVFRIRQEVRPNEHTIGITNLYYTDSSYANTSNTTISSNANSYIKIFGFGFQPNANIVLVPSQNTYLYSSDVTDFFENAVEANSYYVNWGEYRVQVNQNAANTYPITTEYNLFLINSDGSNAVLSSGLKYSSANVFYGWTAGGHRQGNPTDISSVFRYDFSNETFQFVNGLNNSEGRISSITNSTFAWLLGGCTAETPQLSTSNVERLSLFNDTSAISLRTSLSKQIGAATSAKTLQYGYIIGGYVRGSGPGPVGTYSTIERLDLYNDSIILSERTFMSGNSSSEWASVQNATHFWVNGGTTVITPQAFSSRVLRLAFSSDTSQVEQRVTSGLAKARLASVYDTTYGWFGGGQSSVGPTFPAISIVDRLTFSSDTSALSSRGSLNTARQYLGSTQDSTYGWFIAGAGTGLSSVSNVDRITFSNDTVTADRRSNFAGQFYGVAAMSNYQV
jgi:hypothetical protein